MELPKYSMGIGDRFGREGAAQLAAFVEAKALGVDVTPVWNKSNREHLLVGTVPTAVRQEADAAVRALSWAGPYFVDADHIGLKTVDGFIEASDYFTIDVADFTGKSAEAASVDAFVSRFGRYAGRLEVPGIERPLEVSADRIRAIAGKYLLAAQEAGKIYRHVEAKKGKGRFVTEVSMDETDEPQTPDELLFILAAIAQEGIPAQAIAPKFTGRFNKGVDYVGEVKQFEREFDADVCVIAFAVREFGLPGELKLSVHSGSDKFSIYPGIRACLSRRGAGVHLKTAGTTWLEELIGLAEAGGEGLAIARELYRAALARFDEVCKPYATVIDIDKAKLPSPAEVDGWSGAEYADALRHDQACLRFNPHFRQLLHVGFRVAAEMGQRYLEALDSCRDAVARNVTVNILDRHLRRVFVG
jgi:hypothetical protein